MGTLIRAKWTSRQNSELQRELEDEIKQLSRQEEQLAQMQNAKLPAIENLNNYMQEGKLAQMKNATLTVLEILNNIMQEGNHVPTRKNMQTVHENVNSKMRCVRDDGRVEIIVKATQKRKIKPRHEDGNGKKDRFHRVSFVVLEAALTI